MEGAWYDAERVAASRKSGSTDRLFRRSQRPKRRRCRERIDQVDVNVNVTEKNRPATSRWAPAIRVPKRSSSPGRSRSQNIFGSGNNLSLAVNTGKINRYAWHPTPTRISRSMASARASTSITAFGFPIDEKETLKFRAGDRPDDDRHHSRSRSRRRPVHPVPARARRLEHHAAGDRVVDQRYPQQLDLSRPLAASSVPASRWRSPVWICPFYRLTYQNSSTFR
jgi:hypothetical protein